MEGNIKIHALKEFLKVGGCTILSEGEDFLVVRKGLVITVIKAEVDRVILTFRSIDLDTLERISKQTVLWVTENENMFELSLSIIKLMREFDKHGREIEKILDEVARKLIKSGVKISRPSKQVIKLESPDLRGSIFIDKHGWLNLHINGKELRLLSDKTPEEILLLVHKIAKLGNFQFF